MVQLTRGTNPFISTKTISVRTSSPAYHRDRVIYRHDSRQLTVPCRHPSLIILTVSSPVPGTSYLLYRQVYAQNLLERRTITSIRVCCKNAKARCTTRRAKISPICCQKIGDRLVIWRVEESEGDSGYYGSFQHGQGNH